MKQKRFLLIVLLAALACSIGYAWWATPRQQSITPGEAGRLSSASGAGSETSPSLADKIVRFDILGKEPKPFPGAERDIFNFHQEKVVQVPKPKPVVKPAPRPAVVAPKPVSPSVVTKPRTVFTLLGYLEIGVRKIVFLSTHGEIYVVEKGDHFGSKEEFAIEDVSDNTLTIHEDGHDLPTEVAFGKTSDTGETVSTPAKIQSLPAPPVVDEAEKITPFSRPQDVSPSQEDTLQEPVVHGAGMRSGKKIKAPVVFEDSRGDVDDKNQ